MSRSTARRGAIWLFVSVWALLALPGTASADIVTTWVSVSEAVAPRFGGPQLQSRAQAMTQIAVHDALNTIVARYARYASSAAFQPNASPDAAVAAAARRVLLDLLVPIPDSALKQAAITLIDSTFAASLGPEPYDAATQAGIAVGEAAANAILTRRVGDGSATPHVPYTLAPGPGIYQPTPNPEFPAAITPLFAGWAHVTPFSLRHGAQFEVEPGAIFALQGYAHTREYNEVKIVGDARVRGVLPDSEETNIARFWPGGGANWNGTTRAIVSGLSLDRWQHARLFALVNIAVADGLIANQTWKYIHNFWRPVTAIRWPDDGNPDTEPDPAWRPFLVTPPYPDFASALSTGAGAALAVLREYFGTDDISFRLTVNAPSLPLPAPLAPLAARTITRSFTSFSQALEEAQSARVYAGLHFREACVAGGRQGTQIGRFVIGHELRPLNGNH